ncbi:MAG: hypothetical protein WCR51_11600 [Planctomycetia bacterium]
MFRTTRWASLLVGALAVLTGVRSTLARPTDAPPREPHSIVAQSTKATAGTGRRPISQRIMASNLPLRAPTPPDCAQDACHDDAIASDVAQPSESDAVVTDDRDDAAVAVVDAAPAPAVTTSETVTPDVPADATADALVASDPVTLPPEIAVHVEDSALAAPEFEPDASPRIAAAAAPALVMPVAAPGPTVRQSLLKRIKGALGTRTKAPEQAPTAESRPAPGQIPIAPEGSPAIAFGQPTPADEADARAASDSMAAEDPVGDVPARLEFDVRESRSLVGEGEQIVMRIAVRNVGGETAERVTATLFFAEGIEPVQAIGQSAEVYPGEVRFEAVPQLSPGSSVDLLVTAVGTRPGSVTYRGELECRQMAGRIAREGAVTVRAKRVAQP